MPSSATKPQEVSLESRSSGCADPAIIFLDEPTSGLDARASSIVMRGIRNIAKQTGKTVICTIHQPSTKIFEMFDRLLLLKRGGETVYFGPLGDRCHTLIEYFHSIPGVQKCAPDANPASYMLEVIGAGVGRQMNRDFATEYAHSVTCVNNTERLSQLLVPAPGATPVSFKNIFAQPYGVQFTSLLSKNARSYWRMPEYNLVRGVFMIVLGLLFGSLYFDNDATTQPGAFARISVVFITTVFVGVVNQNTCLGVMLNERAVFYREKAAGMYSTWTYNAAAGLVELPYLAFNALLFCCILYFMVGLRATAASFGYYVLCFALYSSMATFFGQLLAMISPNSATANVLSPLFVSIWSMFCGYGTPKPDIPKFWIFLYWLSPMRYFFEAIISDQFQCNSDECIMITVPNPHPQPGQPLSLEVSGEQFVRDSFGMDADNKYEALWRVSHR